MIITGINFGTAGFRVRAPLRVANAPTIGTALMVSNTTANVTYTVPGFTGDTPIESYTAIAFPGGATGILNTSGSGTITVTGLTDNTNYTFSVTANNTDGPSTNSLSTNSILTNSFPTAPTISYVELTSFSTANIVYTAPAYNGNSVITAYTAVSNVGGITATVNTANSGNITITGLISNTSYSFSVYAINQYGRGPSSNLSNGIFTVSIPGAPTLQYVRVLSGTTAEIVYTANNYIGNSNIVSYTATSNPGNISATVNTANSGNIIVGGLTIGTDYSFTVTATNLAGTSLSSNSSFSIKTFDTPGAPTITSWTIGSTTANIGYSAPSYNGNSNITSYTLVSVPENKTATVSTASSGSILLTGLTPNTTYVFSVYASNPVGSSVPSIPTPYLTTPALADIYFKNTTLLLSGNGTNNANNNVFVDSSSFNYTIARTGNPTQGTFTPYGSNWSNYFDGSGDYLSIPDGVSFEMGTGDFTIEAWVSPSALSASDSRIWSYQGAGGTVLNLYILASGTGSQFAAAIRSHGATGYTQTNGTTVAKVGTWYHVAFSRSSGTTKLFVNGTQEGSTQTSQTQNIQTPSSPSIGGYSTGSSEYFTGYIFNIRVIKGNAIYTSNFTPSTTPLTAIANTSLLTCQSNNFKDNSTNNFTLTRNGDVSIQRFSPFRPNAAYSTSTIGGSAYFDGTGDYLTVPANAVFAPGIGPFTVEGWYYSTAASGDQQMWAQTVSGTDYFSVWFIPATSQFLFIGIGYGVYSPAIVNPKCWNHFAVVRDATNITVYANGVAGSPIPFGVGYNFNNTTYVPTISGYTHSQTLMMTGYLSNFRYVKGTSVYTGNFTPPTSPLLTSGTSSIYPNTANVNTTFAAANTSLLCNFTNAGIIDNAMMNNLETQTNAKISTTQSKFGGSSMVFDGSSALSIPYTPLLNFGSGNFTIEFWTYVTATPSAEQYFLAAGPAGGGGVHRGFRMAAHNGSAAGIYFYAGGIASNAETLLGSFPSINAWHHIAIVRNGTTITGYVNGTALGTTINASTTAITDIISGDYSFVGALQNAAPNGRLFYNGYIDDLRITKGVERYTATFTPPTAPLEIQ